MIVGVTAAERGDSMASHVCCTARFCAWPIFPDVQCKLVRFIQYFFEIKHNKNRRFYKKKKKNYIQDLSASP